MSKLPRISLLFALLAIPFATISQAQLMTTTIGGGYSFNTSHAVGATLIDGRALTQTFSDTTSIDTVTFRFMTTSPGAAAQTLDVYFSEWSGNNATSSIGVGTFELTASGTWAVDSGVSYYDMAFDLTSVAGSLTALNTYGLTVVGNADTDSSGYRLGVGNAGYGDGASQITNSVSAFANLTSGGSSPSADYVFTANSVAGYDAFAPVPEASSVAVLFAGVFVGLMATRRNRRQQLAVAETV